MVEERKRGLAGLSPERRREIAAMGGRAARQAGVAHSFTAEEAVAAGRKGGQTLSQDREHMAEIGRRGGFSKARGKIIDIADSEPIDELPRNPAPNPLHEPNHSVTTPAATSPPAFLRLLTAE